MSNMGRLEAPRLWLVLSRCYRAVSQIAERSIEEVGLGLTDFAALEALLHKGPLTITEIQGKVLLASGSMTAAVDLKAQLQGQIDRHAEEMDALAAEIRFRVVKPVCDKHGLKFISGMGTFFFSKRNKMYDSAEDAPVRLRAELRPVFELLNTEAADRHPIGFLVCDYDPKDPT